MRATSTPDGPPPKRYRNIVIYNVLKDGKVVAEFTDLPSARAEAVRIIGKIQVGNKSVET